MWRSSTALVIGGGFDSRTSLQGASSTSCKQIKRTVTIGPCLIGTITGTVATPTGACSLPCSGAISVRRVVRRNYTRKTRRDQALSTSPTCTPKRSLRNDPRTWNGTFGKRFAGRVCEIHSTSVFRHRAVATNAAVSELSAIVESVPHTNRLQPKEHRFRFRSDLSGTDSSDGT